MAAEFPSSKVYGLDFIPSFPDTCLPNNVEFIETNIIDCVNCGLPFRDAEFDYVYCRDIMFSFKTSDFDSVIMKEILRIVKPGGYIEVNFPSSFKLCSNTQFLRQDSYQNNPIVCSSRNWML